MAVTATPYNNARHLLGTAGLNLSTATIKALLVTSTYVPDFDAHDYLDDVTNEVSGSGYARQTLANKTWSKDAPNDRSKLSSDPVAWTAAGGSITARRAILFVDTGTPATSPLIGAILLDDTPADVVVNDGGVLTLTPDATGGWLKV